MFKAKVALAAMAGDKTLAELAQRFEVPMTRSPKPEPLATSGSKNKKGVYGEI